ncbi:tetratricopeptide (TPR) repeat protein [Cytobacillus horneckiae]
MYLMAMGIKKRAKRVIRSIVGGKEKNHQKPYIEMGENWESDDLPIAFMFGFNPWKREHMSHFFKEYRTAYVFGQVDMQRLQTFFKKYQNKVFIIWGFKEPDGLVQYAAKKKINIYRVEDGFVRSVGLGAAHTLPISIAVDSRTLYFNAREASDLEVLLETYDVSEELLAQADRCIDLLVNMGVSKYNHTTRMNINDLYGQKTKKRILVIGQVEDDASIQYGCSQRMTNNELVWKAYNENPECEIIYKPHPDVLGGYRKAYSNPQDVAQISKVVVEPLSIVDALQTIDHVYTMTSLVGFEALIRGIEVTCYGAPFYAGWGLTQDRQACPRRTRKRTIKELFAISYLVYPRYINPETGTRINLEEAIELLIHMMAKNTLSQALESRNENDNDQAEEWIHKAMEQLGDNKDWLYKECELELIKLLNETRRYEEALELSNATLKNESNLEYLIEKGRALTGLREYEEAVQVFLMSLKEEKRYSNLTAMISLLWKIEGPSSRLLKYVDQMQTNEAITMTKEDLIMLAAIYNQAGYTKKAQAMLREAKVKPREIPYLSLAVNYDYYRMNASTVSEKFVYDHMIKTEKRFEELIKSARGKFSVVIAADLFDKEMAEQEKLIVGFTRSQVDINTNKKTNVLFGPLHPQLHEQTNIRDLDLLVMNVPNVEHCYSQGVDYIRSLIERGTSIQSYPHPYYHELIKILGRQPSDEMLLIYWIYKIQGPVQSENIIGIDSIQDEREYGLINSFTFEKVLH